MLWCHLSCVNLLQCRAFTSSRPWKAWCSPRSRCFWCPARWGRGDWDVISVSAANSSNSLSNDCKRKHLNVWCLGCPAVRRCWQSKFHQSFRQGWAEKHPLGFSQTQPGVSEAEWLEVPLSFVLPWLHVQFYDGRQRRGWGGHQQVQRLGQELGEVSTWPQLIIGEIRHKNSTKIAIIHSNEFPSVF